MTPRFAPIPASLPATVPFVGAEQMERGRGRPFKAWLGANELTLPPSPRVIEALAKAARDEISFYPDAPSHLLTDALAAHHQRAPEEIVVGEGIDGLLGLCVRLLLAPGEVAVTSLGAYPTFNYHVAGFGGVVDAVPYRDDAEDLEALAARARATNAKLLYVSNPDNPMGSWHSHAAIAALIDAVPGDCTVLLDEAYGEFHTDPAAITPTGFTRPNLIRLGTFSKAYGMAGLRVGYALAEAPLAAGFHRIRNHFGVNRMAQAAAIAALADADHLTATLKTIAEGRAQLAGIAKDNGLTPLPSATNFVTMDCGRDGAFARQVLEEILVRDVFIRMPGPDPLNRCIRVSVGTAEENRMFGTILPASLAGADTAVRSG